MPKAGSGLSAQECQRFERLGIKAIEDYKRPVLELADKHGEDVIKRIISPEILGPKLRENPEIFAMAAVITMRASTDPARRATPESIFLAHDIIKSTPGLCNPKGMERTLNFASVLSHYSHESGLPLREAGRDAQKVLRVVPVKERMNFLWKFGNLFEPVEGSFKDQRTLLLGTEEEKKAIVDKDLARLKKDFPSIYKEILKENRLGKTEAIPLRKPARSWSAVRPKTVSRK